MPIPSLHTVNKCSSNAVCKTSVRKPNQNKKTLQYNARSDEKLVNLSDSRIQPTSLASLYAGSYFTGIQKCGSTQYEVSVELKNVDLKQSVINGYLNIKGLTVECPEITTFFEGEIIGDKYSFLTRKWQAEQYIDAAHWEKFSSFKPYADRFNRDDFVYNPFDNDFVYMRWKEKFLVPDHRVDSISGASFAGFYYICYQRSTNQIKGYYFYRHNTEWYQELFLKHSDQSSFTSYEFR